VRDGAKWKVQLKRNRTNALLFAGVSFLLSLVARIWMIWASGTLWHDVARTIPPFSAVEVEGH
jgi:hypothetical protein